jgi:hypothetical protein
MTDDHVSAALRFVLMGYTLHVGSTQLELTWKMIIVGIGLGPVLPILTLAIQGTVAPRDIGAATGTSNFLRTLGSTIGVAILGTLFASSLKDNIQQSVTAATHTLPATVRSQFAVSGSGKSSSQGLDAAQVRRQLNQTFDANRATYTAALQNGDPAAIRKLLANPQTPAALRPVLNQGGFAGAVRAQFSAQRTLFTRALVQRDPAAIQAVTTNAQTPAALKTLVRNGAGAAAPQVLAGLNAQEQTVLATQPTAALNQVQGLENTRAQLLPVIDRVGDGIKQAFTDSVELLYRVGLWITLAALALSFLLPEAKPTKVSSNQLTEDEFSSTEIL